MMGEKCPSTLLNGGNVSTSAGGNAACCCAAVVVAGVVVGVGARKSGRGMVGAPAQAVRIKLIRRRQFRVKRLALSLVEVKRCFIIGKPSKKEVSEFIILSLIM